MSESTPERSPRERQVDALIVEFELAAEQGRPLNREEFLKQHPEYATELREYLDDISCLHAAVQPKGINASISTADYQIKNEHAGGVIADKYTLIEPIGEGGMGSVWRAKQTEPVRRFVAVKLIKAGMDSKQVLARFDAERQALAMMDHPNIAKVFDGGLHQHRPYFVMELVKGVPITDYCDKCKLTPKERLELFVPVCQAIQHAHQKGIIHRDIKPSNVLIALYDDKPVAKVIDFGVAKATGGALTEATLDTGIGAVLGTPQYMSPEQATFNNLDIDTRSDVYALGLLLYELLTGSPPFSKQELEKKGLLEILRIVREAEPPRPSKKLSTSDALPTLSANRGTEPKKLTGLLRNELDWIVMKALEKDRARRYETATSFAADINRYLAGEAVMAHPPSTGYRLKKAYRKNRGPVIFAGVILLALLAGVIGTTVGLLEAGVERDKARVAEGKAIDLAQIASDERDKAIRERDEKEKAQVLEREARRIAQDRLVRSHVRSGKVAIERDEGFDALHWFWAAWQADAENPERDSIHRLRLGSTLSELPMLQAVRIHSGQLTQCSLSPDGQKVLSYTKSSNSVEVWNPNTGRLVFTPLLHPDTVRSAEWATGGKCIFTRAYDHGLRVWDAQTGKLIGQPIHSEGKKPLSAVGLSPDGTIALVSGQGSNTIESVEVATGKTVMTWKIQGDAISLRYSPQGDRFASAVGDMAMLWDLKEAEPLAVFPHQALGYQVGSTNHANPTADQMPLFTPDGRLLVTLVPGAKGFAVWSTSTGKPIAEQKQIGGTYGATLSPSGHLVLCYPEGSIAGYCTVSETATGKHIAKIDLNRNISNGCFFPDEKSVLLRSAGSGVERVEIATGRIIGPVLRSCGKDRLSPQISPDGEMILMSEFDGIARVWRLPPAEPNSEYDLANGGPTDGQVATRDGNVWFEHANGRLLVATRTAEPVALADAPLGDRNWLSPDGRRAVVADKTRGYRIWDTATGIPLTDWFTSPLRSKTGWLPGPDNRLWASFTPDGKHIYTLSGISEFECRETVNWRLVPERTIRHENVPILAVRLSPDGLHLATGVRAPHANVFSTANPTAPPRMLVHGGWVEAVDFSPDGRRIVTASGDLTARVWDIDSGQPAGPVLRITKPFREATFSPDGELILTVEETNATQLWGWRTGDLVATLPRLKDPLRHANWFSTDGRFFAYQPAAPTKKPVGIRLERTGLDRTGFSTYLELLTAARLDETESIVPLSLGESSRRVAEYRRVWLKQHPELAVPDPFNLLQNEKIVPADVAELPKDPLTPEQAAKLVDQTVVVQMTIRSVGRSRSGKSLYLNTHADYKNPDNFTVVVLGPTPERLKELGLPRNHELLVDQKVIVRGKVEIYQGKLQVRVLDDSKIWILASEPTESP